MKHVRSILLVLIMLTAVLFAKRAQADCSGGDCIGGCTAVGVEAYCTAVECSCNCIYLDVFGVWHHSPQPCPEVWY